MPGEPRHLLVQKARQPASRLPCFSAGLSDKLALPPSAPRPSFIQSRVPVVRALTGLCRSKPLTPSVQRVLVPVLWQEKALAAGSAKHGRSLCLLHSSKTEVNRAGCASPTATDARHQAECAETDRKLSIGCQA
ncbi:hypothetical protein AAFF_G00020330 [Aldrovandia affinis]|uniref:Uncharacterized protein n=1 Tax=Aldrovandia affinis TaxID=143900 RepID=A0AAD7S577_9TELE|nr:hypothetical protein AAFF_G00020330 [Aldrovandia affinis]